MSGLLAIIMLIFKKMFGGLYMYPFILVHELGHAICISKIASKYGIIDKPIIVMGDFNYNKSHIIMPSHRILEYDVYHEGTYLLKKGITLFPSFKFFSEKDIRLCARAGCIAELIMSTLLIFLFIILQLSFFNLFFHILGAFWGLFGIIHFICFGLTIIKSSDKKVWCDPASLDCDNIELKYQSILSRSSVSMKNR